MNTNERPFACDLTQLTARQGDREKALLRTFKAMVLAVEETSAGWRFRVPASPESLRDVGEFLALERLCCPFLQFTLGVDASEEAVIHVFGREGAKPVIEAEFRP